MEEWEKSAKSCENINCSLETVFETSFKHIKEALQSLCSSRNFPAESEESLQKITSWESVFDSYAKKLGMQKLCEVLQSIFCMVGFNTNACFNRLLLHHIISFHRLPHLGCFMQQKMVDRTGSSDLLCLPFHVRKHYKLLHTSLEQILNFADDLLRDFLTLHKTVSRQYGCFCYYLFYSFLFGGTLY